MSTGCRTRLHEAVGAQIKADNVLKLERTLSNQLDTDAIGAVGAASPQPAENLAIVFYEENDNDEPERGRRSVQFADDDDADSTTPEQLRALATALEIHPHAQHWVEIYADNPSGWPEAFPTGLCGAPL